MNDFLTDLYNYISEHTPSLKDDFEYQRTLQAYMELEAKVKEKIGDTCCINISVQRRTSLIGRMSRFLSKPCGSATVLCGMS